MKIIERRYKRVIPVAILFLVFLTGCVTTRTIKNASDEEVLKQRVTAYWDYKIKGEFEKSYEYESPLYRKKVDLVNYIRSFGTGTAKWTGVKITGMAIQGDLAQVHLKIRVKLGQRVVHGKEVELWTAISEPWMKQGGVWYHVEEKTKLGMNKVWKGKGASYVEKRIA